MEGMDRYQKMLIVMAIGAVLLACICVPNVNPGGGEATEEGPASGSGELPGGVQAMRADTPRDLSPAVSEADLSELVDGNRAFALALYDGLRGEPGNIVYSPYSISLALAMAFAGARGETEQQMAETLHYTLPQDRLHPAFDALDLALASREEAARGEGGEGRAFQLNIANALWGQMDYPFSADYLEVVARNYGSGINLVDFTQAPEDSRVAINDWVEQETEGLIEDLLPRGSITSDTRLVLTNAIYFYGPWLHPFSENLTQDSSFTLLDGTQVMAPMMYQQTERALRYTAGDGYQVVEIPYEGEDVAMLILLPDAGQFEAFESALDESRFAQIVDGLSSYEQVRLNMPRFEFESPSISLASMLADMGMPVAFSDMADFSGMVDMEGNPQLAISDVVHKAYIRVDEAGTEAAAATGVVVGLTSAMPDYITVSVDRPFIYAIVDRPTGAILFMGRVVDPR
jgi:serpin B